MNYGLSDDTQTVMHVVQPDSVAAEERPFLS